MLLSIRVIYITTILLNSYILMNDGTNYIWWGANTPPQHTPIHSAALHGSLSIYNIFTELWPL